MTDARSPTARTVDRGIGGVRDEPPGDAMTATPRSSGNGSRKRSPGRRLAVAAGLATVLLIVAGLPLPAAASLPRCPDGGETRKGATGINIPKDCNVGDNQWDGEWYKSLTLPVECNFRLVGADCSTQQLHVYACDARHLDVWFVPTYTPETFGWPLEELPESSREHWEGSPGTYKGQSCSEVVTADATLYWADVPATGALGGTWYIGVTGGSPLHVSYKHP